MQIDAVKWQFACQVFYFILLIVPRINSTKSTTTSIENEKSGATMSVNGENNVESKQGDDKIKCQFCERLFPNTGKGRQSRGTHETAMHWAELQAIISAGNGKSWPSNANQNSKTMGEIVTNPNLQLTNENQHGVGSVVPKQIFLPLHPNAFKCEICHAFKTGSGLSSHSKTHIVNREHVHVQNGVIRSASAVHVQAQAFRPLILSNAQSTRYSYKCEICSAIYPTAQSLGNHRRGHSFHDTNHMAGTAAGSDKTKTASNSEQKIIQSHYPKIIQNNKTASSVIETGTIAAGKEVNGGNVSQSSAHNLKKAHFAHMPNEPNKNATERDQHHNIEAAIGGNGSLNLRSSVSDDVSTIRHTQSNGANEISHQSTQRHSAIKESRGGVDIGMEHIRSDFAIFKKEKHVIIGKHNVELNEQSDSIAERQQQQYQKFRSDEHLTAMASESLPLQRHENILHRQLPPDAHVISPLTVTTMNQQKHQKQHGEDQLQRRQHNKFNELQQPLIASTSNQQHQPFGVNQEGLTTTSHHTFKGIGDTEMQQNSPKINDEISNDIFEDMADAEAWLMSSEAQELYQLLQQETNDDQRMEFVDREPLLPSNMSEQNREHNQKFDENCAMVDEEELNDWLNPPNPQTEFEALELNMQSVAPENGKTNLTEMQVDELETNKMDSNSPSNVKNKQGGGGQSNESGASNQQQFVKHEEVQPNHVNNSPAEHVIDSTSPAFDDQQHSFSNSFVAQKHAEQLNHSNNRPYLAVQSPGTWSTGTSTMPMSRQHQNRLGLPSNPNKRHRSSSSNSTTSAAHYKTINATTRVGKHLTTVREHFDPNDLGQLTESESVFEEIEHESDNSTEKWDEGEVMFHVGSRKRPRHPSFHRRVRSKFYQQQTDDENNYGRTVAAFLRRVDAKKARQAKFEFERVMLRIEFGEETS